MQNVAKPVFETVDDKQGLKRAAGILAAAFHDDPLLGWMLGEGVDMEPFFDFTLAMVVPHGLTYVDPMGRGAAAWLAPGQQFKWRYRLSDVLQVVRTSGLGSLGRLAVAGVKTGRYHPRERHYYLFAIGARPEHKGQGVGTALIAHVLRICDEKVMPAYLENSKEENLPFYEGHGFRVTRKIRLAASAPPLWLMWREPRPTVDGAPG
jgi:GNAT superfamily N-acetyltransferase